MDDLGLKNHLSGIQRRLLKVNFFNVQALQDVKRELQGVVQRNKARARSAHAQLGARPASKVQGGAARDTTHAIAALREHDVSYPQRVAIDLDLRAGQWYSVAGGRPSCRLTHLPEMKRMAEPSVCAFDIECTKLPLQFPNAESDQVFMISYMVDGKGFLVINREFVAQDIVDFEYTPRAEFQGPFQVINVENEKVRPYLHVGPCTRRAARHDMYAEGRPT